MTIPAGGLGSPMIMRPSTSAKLQGQTYEFPTAAEVDEANTLTRRQFELFNESCRLGISEEDEGRRLSIARQVAACERMKHRLLMMDAVHLLPASIRARLVML